MEPSVTDRTPHHRHPFAIMIVGLVIAAFGLTLLAGNLGYIDAHRVLQEFWPFGLIIVGVATLATRRHDQVFLGLALVFAGAWAYAAHQNWLRVSFWAVFGPTVLVLAGGSIIWRAFARPSLAANESYVTSFAILGGSELQPKVPFQGADLTCVMGGAKLDLTATAMAGDTAAIDVFALMGGAEILVPRDWDVTVKVISLMGGVSDKRRPATLPPTKRLVIRGFAMMGGVEIKD